MSAPSHIRHSHFRTLVSVLALTGSMIAASQLVGCDQGRPAMTSDELLARRNALDAQLDADRDQMFSRLLRQVHAKALQSGAARPTIDILIVSGGGDWGAFGAGVLKGWNTAPQGELSRPEFDIVTGVSTGALIAPFAFLGEAQDDDRIVELYRNPKSDWVQTRGVLYFLPSHESFATVPGLEREMRSNIDLAMIKRMADAGADGRMLVVNTTDIDDSSLHAWDVIAESRRAVDDGSIDRVHQILLASAGIPAAFPAREIDGVLYVDGGVTGNILYGARLAENQSLAAQWERSFPNEPQPRIRYWVIFNNQLRPTPTVVAKTWPAIVSRSLEASTRHATVTALRHLYLQAEIARLKHNGEIEVRLISIPETWTPPVPGVFKSETMNDLADLGERMGADPASWRNESP